VRWTLVCLTLYTTSAAALAFLVPLLVFEDQVAGERALADARLRAAATVPALVTGADPAAVRSGSARLTVYPSTGGPVGAARARPADVRAVVMARLPATRDVPGGAVYLHPVDRGGGVTVVEVFVPDADLHRGVLRSRLVLVAIAIAVVLGAVTVADRVGARAARALGDLAAAIRRFGPDDLARRVTPAGGYETAVLGRSFNTMADRIVDLLRGEHQRAADLSHRLRTPLTALRLKVEALPSSPDNDGIRRAMAALSDEVDRIIRAARHPDPAFAAGRCDVTEVLAERLAFWAVLAEDDNRPWAAVGGDAPLWVAVPREQAVAAVDALLGNVFHHTPEGTAFRAGVIGTTLVVEDDGPGIGPGVGDPAPDPAPGLRGSTGLGLNIARRMAGAAGGTLVVDRAASGGARVEIRFP
jgi:signal transduction histidine kinase